MIEYDFAVAYESVLRERQLAIGAANVQNKQIETSEQIIERIQGSVGYHPSRRSSRPHAGSATCRARLPSVS
jgi:hypothetical protein